MVCGGRGVPHYEFWFPHHKTDFSRCLLNSMSRSCVDVSFSARTMRLYYRLCNPDHQKTHQAPHPLTLRQNISQSTRRNFSHYQDITIIPLFHNNYFLFKSNPTRKNKLLWQNCMAIDTSAVSGWVHHTK